VLKKVSDLFSMVKDLKSKKLVCIASADEEVLEAIHDACEMGSIEATLIGPLPEIAKIMHEKKYRLEDYTIIDCDDNEKGSEYAMQMVNRGEADIIMKGLLDTRVVLKAVVNKEYGIRKAALLNHVGLASFPQFNRTLFFTDGAMLIAPSVEDRIHMIQNSVDFMHLLGYEQPKVGLVSAVEKVNPKMQSTVDAQAIVEQYRSGRVTGCIVDGPFAVDNCVSVASAVHKGIVSPVAGWCDLLVFPTIEAGNVFYKTAVHLAKADVAGIILGAKVPIVLTSRADSRQAKLNSIILSCLVSKNY